MLTELYSVFYEGFVDLQNSIIAQCRDIETSKRAKGTKKVFCEMNNFDVSYEWWIDETRQCPATSRCCSKQNS